VGTGYQMAAALAMGAQGVWTGSLWLTVEEAETPPEQMESLFNATSHDTVRSRSWTGKPCRMLRNDWTEAWASTETPDPLGMPLQFMVTADAVSRTSRYASKAQPVAFNPVGQIVGVMNEREPVRDVVMRMVEQYLEAVENLNALMPED
jgi:NAD(P)H-dependent flavin oxidoreductase YrpB (nitropropane dioxygenase family)